MFRFLAAGLITVGVLCAQGVDPSLVLARTRDRVLDLAERLPRYTCIQTVDRIYFGDSSHAKTRATCDQYFGNIKRNSRRSQIEATDRLRLDVIVTGGREVYAWAGASHFDARFAGDFIGDGPIGTGPFGTFVLDIFRNDKVSFEYQDSAQLRGKTVLKYAYKVPLEASHYMIRNKDRNWRATAFSGSLWVNPGTYELQRLTVETSELNPDTGACTADTRVDYQTVSLGTGAFLLPLESELHFVLMNGTETRSTATFAKCREYLAESSLSFDEASSEAKPPVVLAKPRVPIPVGLKVVLRLTGPIDTQLIAAGDMISARVQDPVTDPIAHTIVIPAGAIVRGRIVRMEHRLRPARRFVISVEWAQLEDHNVVAPFSARINEPAQFQNRRHTLWLSPPGNLRKREGSFILPTTKDRYVVPAGSESTWITN